MAKLKVVQLSLNRTKSLFVRNDAIYFSCEQLFTQRVRAG